MYSWNKELIIKHLETLNKKNNKTNTILYDINTLQDLLINEDNENTIENNLKNELDEYKEYRRFLVLINKIIEKYKDDEDIEIINYNKLSITKKESIEFSKHIINQISPKWYNTLSPIINSKDLIDFKKYNSNYITYLKSINQLYISLEKTNDIDDYIAPTHEFLHAYSVLQNYKFFYNIECEFVSMLGEMIIRYEMKKENFHTKEFIKSKIKDFYILIDFIISILYRTDTIKNNIDPVQKINYLHKKFKHKKKDLLYLYRYSLEYMYNYLISYFLSIELLEIYKKDKEKSIYIADDIILDNRHLFTKLKKHNITLLENEEYIKELKKEYTILNNQ